MQLDNPSTHQESTEELPPLLQLPLLTSLVFVLLVLIILWHFAGSGVASLAFLLFLIFFGLKITLADPHRFLAKLHPIEKIDDQTAELVARLKIRRDFYCGTMGISRAPDLVLVEDGDVPVQIAGNFWRSVIVLNRPFISRASKGRFANFVNVILVHELAHLKYGDIWKVKLASGIAFAAFLYSLFIILISSGSPASLERFFQGSPLDRSTFILEIVLIVPLFGTLLLLILLLRRLRELYADEWVKHLVGETELNVVLALVPVLDLEEIHDVGISKPAATGFGRWIPRIRDRVSSFFGMEDTRLDFPQGRLFRSSILFQVVFISGMGLGFLFFSLGDALLYFIFAFPLIGLAVILTYLLPHLHHSDPHRYTLVRKSLMATAIYVSGLLAIWIPGTLLVSFVLYFEGVYRQFVLNELQFGLATAGLLVLQGLILFLSVLAGLPVLRAVHERWVVNLNRTWTWPDLLVPIASCLSIFMVLDYLLLFIFSRFFSVDFGTFLGIMALIGGSLLLSLATFLVLKRMRSQSTLRSEEAVTGSNLQ